jgi:hypothetical protein
VNTADGSLNVRVISVQGQQEVLIAGWMKKRKVFSDERNEFYNLGDHLLPVNTAFKKNY